MERSILHCDCNGFYASVECVRDPSLRSVPMAVCGNPENRHGIILAKNEPAKKYGIRTAETVWSARNKCPELVLVSPHRDLYMQYSKQVNDIYKQYTDQVEPFGIDESWLDVTGSLTLFGSGKEIADTLRQRIRSELGLTISVGVSFNKVFAKLGSDYKKPDATTVIDAENWQKIIFPLPADTLLFVGRSTREKLAALRVETIGDLAASDKELLFRHLGKIGAVLWEYANGLDDSPVAFADTEQEIKSVGNSITFKRNLINWEEVKIGLDVLSDSVAARMRKKGLKGTTVQVAVKDTELKTVSRQKKLSSPSCISREISNTAMSLIRSFWPSGKPIRMLNVTCAGLLPADTVATELTLFDTPEELKKRDRLEKLEATLDKLRERYPDTAVRRAAQLENRGLGIESEETTDKDLPK